MSVLPATPSTAAAGSPVEGLWSGGIVSDPVASGSRRGRVRRWLYAAAGEGDTAVGAAIVDLGVVGTAFVWAVIAGQVVTWERLRPLGLGCRVASVPAGGASFRGRGGDRVTLAGDGALTVDVGLGRERLRAEVTAGPVTPAHLATATAGGGWNATEKAAGYRTRGELTLGGLRFPVGGGGWRDWTAGRQDRHTEWRWAAGAGSDIDGTRLVGLNVSTGMNAAGAGEDVVWWDGEPHALEVTTLAPVGADLAGPWRIAGPGWDLHLDPVGARAADDDLLLLASRYVQPVGRLTGTLPGPEGTPVEVVLTGVTEDHEARW